MTLRFEPTKECRISDTAAIDWILTEEEIWVLLAVRDTDHHCGTMRIKRDKV